MSHSPSQSQSESQHPKQTQNPNTSTLPNAFGGLPPPLDLPDILTNFLRSTEIIATTDPARPSPQQTLKTILNDPRWTRRMLEDWFKKGVVSGQRVGTLTPEPEFRALYLVVLGVLEGVGRERTGLGGSGSGGDERVKEAEKKEEEEEVAEREVEGRIEDWKREMGIR